jgi:hypothetical protein
VIESWQRLSARKEEGALVDYWLAKRTHWRELAGFGLQIVTRALASMATERHFTLFCEQTNATRKVSPPGQRDCCPTMSTTLHCFLPIRKSLSSSFCGPICQP